MYGKLARLANINVDVLKLAGNKSKLLTAQQKKTSLICDKRTRPHVSSKTSIFVPKNPVANELPG